MEFCTCNCLPVVDRCIMMMVDYLSFHFIGLKRLRVWMRCLRIGWTLTVGGVVDVLERLPTKAPRKCGGVSCEEGWWGGWSICEDPRQAGERDQGGGEISSRERDQKAWDDEKMKLEAEVKRLKLSVLGAEKKLNAKQVELDEAFAAKNATAEEAAMFVIDCRFNVNLDVYDNRMLDVSEIGRLKDSLEADAIGDEGTLATTSPNLETIVQGEDGEEEEVEDGEEVVGDVGNAGDNDGD
ncbi:hypothetical protein DEO72_LG6g1184 [Vigna unguiculata]|uniref:Uncharacterized protein n=1 Tax=Vigna unguiculata TaxID=3917 RepID=A0A4D6M723_VIGUN|nr:hypothetical protein DEO72_LG6g1184 [Vigna unguiculata]